MAIVFTGDFDAVMEFTLPAVDRVMAAMHQAGMTTPAPSASFPHSMTLRVDDIPPSPSGTRAHPPVSVVGLSDHTGRAVSNLNQATTVFSTPGSFDAIFHDPSATLGSADSTHGGALEFTHLRGIAQVQLGAPSLTVADDSGSRVSVHMPIRARYLADPDTVVMPEYVRGDLRLDIDVNQVTTETGQAINFDLRGRVQAAFRVDFSIFSLSPNDIRRGFI